MIDLGDKISIKRNPLGYIDLFVMCLKLNSENQGDDKVVGFLSKLDIHHFGK